MKVLIAAAVFSFAGFSFGSFASDSSDAEPTEAAVNRLGFGANQENCGNCSVNINDRAAYMAGDPSRVADSALSAPSKPGGGGKGSSVSMNDE